MPIVARTKFYVGMGAVAVFVAVLSFAPGLFSPHRKAPPTPLVWLHGAAFASWLLFFLLQAGLVAAARPRLHRRLGPVGVLLAVLVVVSGYQTAVAMGRRGFDLSGALNAGADPLGTLVFPLGDLLSFTVLVTAAVLLRRRSESHKRLMVLATAGSLMAAPLAHLIGHFPALQAFPPIILIPLAAFYFAPAIHDRWRDGRVHLISRWGGLLLLAWAQLRAAVIGPSEVWHSLAAWLVG